MAKKGKKDPEKKAALAAKKEAKADKKDLKRAKKEIKALSGDAGEEDVENDSAALDALLQQYQQEGKSDTNTAYTVGLETVFPAARSNATLTLYEDTKKKNAEVYLFGGEFYDGIENVVLDHLFKYDLAKQEWKRVFVPNPSPPARCAHSAVYYNHALYLYGGELATADHYHHYRDVWKYDIRQQTWQEIKPNKATGTHPSPRSGHAATVWKHYMIIFGGFYEANRDTPLWYNDVFVLDLQSQQWLDVPHSKLTARPEPRSACNVDVIADDVVVHGGFSKLTKNGRATESAIDEPAASETKVHTDAWVLHLKPLLQGKPPVWERLTSSIQRKQLAATASKTPNGRSGMAAVAYKNRLLAYGGVVDTEQHHHKMASVFYNDLFAFDVERRKWFPVHVKKNVATATAAASGGRRRRKDNTQKQKGDPDNAGEEDMGDDPKQVPDDSSSSEDLEEEEDDDDEANDKHAGYDLAALRADMFAFLDGEGNIIYEKIEEEDESPDGYDGDQDGEEKEEVKEEEKEEVKEEEKEEEEEEEKEEEKDGDGQVSVAIDTKLLKHQRSRSTTVTSSSVMVVNPDTNAPEPVTRAEPLPRIQSSLIVSGHTLFVYGGLLEVGDREVTLDDLWSFDLRKRDKWECVWPGTMHKQVWRGALHDDDDSYYSTDTGKNENGDDDDDDDDDVSTDDELGEEELQGKKKSKSSKNSGLKQEIAELNEKYNLGDANLTPQPDELLADFYSRTSDYWNDQAANKIKASGSNTELSTKALKREGFSLARDRFTELEHVMERLKEMSLQSKERKKDRKEPKSDKNKDAKSDKNKDKKKKSHRLER